MGVHRKRKIWDERVGEDETVRGIGKKKREGVWDKAGEREGGDREYSVGTQL